MKFIFLLFSFIFCQSLNSNQNFYGRVVDEFESIERKNISNNFTDAVNEILNCNGKIVLSGMGKSGHIARKIASTFASTGTPAFFMHPGEASHGDLGMITKDDIVIFFSNSGQSDELISIFPTIKRIGAKIIGISGNANSELANESDIHISASVTKEACPLGLAPTASTSVSLALGDALAICVLDLREFTAEDFANSHPGGNLGKNTLTKIKDILFLLVSQFSPDFKNKKLFSVINFNYQFNKLTKKIIHFFLLLIV